MRSKKRTDDTEVGEDAFLDTTANLVGILIILVMVIGTKTTIDAQEYSRKLVQQEPSEELTRATSEVVAMREALAKQNLDMQQHELETEYRKRERSRLLTQVAYARESVEERLQSVDEMQRDSVLRQQQISELESELKNVADQAGSDVEQPRPTIVLEHLPTPMAKTVFNREMHVQVRDNRITVIPWDRLVNMLKQQIPLAARRQASRQTLSDTLGPVGGFAMHYQMAAVPGGFELDHFELEVLGSAPAESLEEAFMPTGRLQLELASRHAAETVVTVWVYPESFETFRQLKIRLFKIGFLTAARPLPAGQAIGASPRGTRSSAQ